MKRIILVVFLLGITVFASFLGLYAQDIAYYFKEHLFYEYPFKTLVIVTITSVSLFFIVFVISTILLSIQKLKPRIYIVLLAVNVIVGLLVSSWSLFVLLMWWH
ncbi:hypothetical protein [Oceanobacillus polygoni]|uniref:Uncharacterized protein n=1 Tax=Oceanobacillus polygoni TaxID=1235259 RepID=A0A9X0YV54_9BACI|nr:hypothetical protein [Oceanobacillus polygoni]MBP2079412.1 hypothetical protein [Oceanobacillus polygoni]